MPPPLRFVPSCQSIGVENQWLGAGKTARGEEPRRGVGPDGPARGQAQGGENEVSGHGRRMAAPADATLARVESEDSAPDLRAGLGERVGHWSCHKKAGRGELPAEVPGRVVGSPGAVPAEAVAVDQPAGATDLEVLNDPLELEPLRQFAAVVAAG
jgi:hypothetical protein